MALANTGERFGYYTMLAVFTLFLQANFGFDEKLTSTIFSSFLMFVYFLPLFGGALADKVGYSKLVTIGIFIMFAGYVLLALPLGSNSIAMIAMAGALVLVSIGTGLFKGNLQVMVGDLYNEATYSAKRDAGFSLFYMAINIGAMFAPTAAIKVMEWAQNSLGVSVSESYHYAFGVACASLIVSIAIFYLGRPTYRQVITTKSKVESGESKEAVEELSPAETKERIICLCLVFAVVIFFWMAFHQNGLTLTFFARDYTATTSTGIEAMQFDVTNLVAAIFIVFGLFSLFQGKTGKEKGIGATIVLLPLAYLFWNYTQLPAEGVKVDAPIFQQFNACFVVMLKIGLGMLVAAIAYLLMTVGSIGLPVPEYAADGSNLHMADVSPNLLIETYLILTFAELLLSPIGISFVTKVAPPKYKGMMMGGWFVSTAIGNFLVQIPGYLWGKDLYIVWGALMVICLVAAVFIFSIIKKLNKVS